MSVESTVEEVFRLYRDHGEGNYLGEAVSKTAHSIQAGMLAEKEGFSKEVIIGSFLHDIGHLVGIDQKLDTMITDNLYLGATDHDKVGAQFLRERGFPDLVCDIVGGHVMAKRYLVYKYSDYYQRLSEPSKQTLVHQGGPMSKTEAKTFETSPLFDVILRMRTWDERAKDPEMKLDSIDKYKNMCVEILQD